LPVLEKVGGKRGGYQKKTRLSGKKTKNRTGQGNRGHKKKNIGLVGKKEKKLGGVCPAGSGEGLIQGRLDRALEVGLPGGNGTRKNRVDRRWKTRLKKEGVGPTKEKPLGGGVVLKRS